MAEVLIQGILCKYRDLIKSVITEDGELIDGEKILFSELPVEDQYFRREKPPFSADELTDLIDIFYEERKDKYTRLQREWVEREEKRMTYGNGVYVSIKGRVTYIPASYWAYVNYWTLEHGEKPEYREADRIFFLFMEYICFETDVLAVTRGKGRRQGATSLGFFWTWWICGREKDKKGGSISYNDTMAQKNFQEMFMKGFKEMPICFVRDIDSRSENFVSFKTPKKGQKTGSVNKDEGLKSYVDFLPTTVNSYDGGRSSFLLIDESGKYEKMNINTYWSKVSPTLKKGKNKLGFAYLPTTVNPAKKGGTNYKQFWQDANQNAINPRTGEPYGLNTPHKVVRYLVPATEGYAGCIDKYGDSVIDDPIEPVMGNDGCWITEGARSVILNERSLKTGEQLLEHKRDFPLDEYDMFSFEFGACEFDQERLMLQIDALKSEPVFLRKGRLIKEDEVIKAMVPGQKDRTKSTIKFMDDDTGGWLIYEWPQKQNDFDQYEDGIYPRNMLTYAAGVDTFRIGFAEDGSKGTICIFKKSNRVNGKETGCYPVAMYQGRPRLIQFLYDEIIKGCMWYGCKVNIEISAGDFYYGYFHEKLCSDLLYWTPARDPHNPKQKVKPGTETASPFELAAQLEAAKIFFDGDNCDVYNGNTHRVVFPLLLSQALEYKHDERTPYDLVIALMMALLPVLKPQPNERPVEKIKNLLPTYDLKKTAYN